MTDRGRAKSQRIITRNRTGEGSGALALGETRTADSPSRSCIRPRNRRIAHDPNSVPERKRQRFSRHPPRSANMAFAEAMNWHEGEHKMHELTRVGEYDNPTSPFLTPRAALMCQRYPLMSLGTLDEQKRPWATVWGCGTEHGPLAQQVAPSVLGVRSLVDASFDPVVQACFGGKDDGELVKSEGQGKMVSGLSIYLEERGRVKLYGRMVAGALHAFEEEDQTTEDDKGKKGKSGKMGQAQLVLKIDQSLGNCPKYLNSKRIVSVDKEEYKPQLISDSRYLCRQGVDLLTRKADMFFVSSSHEDQDMDSNHRGGPKGFLRVESNDYPAMDGESPTSNETGEDEEGTGATIIWPEYSGNNLYQTLGNLQTTPRAGLCVPDFETGDVLYMTGTTEVLIGEDAKHVLPKSKLAVRFHVTRALFVERGLPFRGVEIESRDGMGGADGMSPYNPKVWYLKSEKTDVLQGGDEKEIGAVLLETVKLTPTINRYRFALSQNDAFPPWKPGQYVVLTFSGELDMGYSHMRDDDPLSLNDDWLRTFTVSSRYGLGQHGEEFEMTVRNVGAVTGWLARQRVDRGARVDVGVKGFGGDFVIQQKQGTKLTPFVAGGIGITPVVAQLQNLDLKTFRVFWTLGVKDIGLVADCFERYEGLASVTDLFLTGDPAQIPETQRPILEKLKAQSRRCEMRRLRKEDLTAVQDEVENWYLCTAPVLRNQIQEWLPGKPVIYENFDY